MIRFLISFLPLSIATLPFGYSASAFPRWAESCAKLDAGFGLDSASVPPPVTRVEISCYDERGQVRERLLIFDQASGHWTERALPLSWLDRLNSANGVAALTAGGIAVFVLGPAVWGRVWRQARRSLASSTEGLSTAELNSGEAAALDSQTIDSTVSEATVPEPASGPDGVSLGWARFVRAEDLNLTYIKGEIPISDLVIAPEQVPSWARVHTNSRTGEQFMIEHTMSAHAEGFKPSPRFEAIRVDPELKSVHAFAPRGDWSLYHWEERKYAALADPAELAESPTPPGFDRVPEVADPADHIEHGSSVETPAASTTPVF